MNRPVRILCAFLLIISPIAIAQTPGTGLYAFGSFDSRGFDSINIGNLNTHFEIPIVNKQGRGPNFAYSLVYDGLIWTSTDSLGNSVWTPDSGWGFHGQLGGGITGYVTYTDSGAPCGAGPDGQREQGDYYTFTYHDPFGASHLFNYTVTYCPSTGSTSAGDGAANDGSGYSFDGTNVHTRTGSVINAPQNPVTVSSFGGNITDSNGNRITNNGNGTFTDTLGATELTIAGSASAGSPLTLSYPVTLQSDGATAASATAYYRTYTVQTNFQCPGIVEYGATSVDLMDHITLADGVTTYSFSYEPTPGVGGAVTGRLASVTLPTGGTLNYAYTGGCGAGINSDGTVGSLARMTSDGTKNYNRLPNATSTTVQDEKGNQSVYQFTVANGLFYETERSIYQGAASGTPLFDQTTCYNNVASPCNGTSISLPISETKTLASNNGGSQVGVEHIYDAYGGLISTTQTSGGSSFTVTTTTSYNTLEEPLGTTTADGSGNVISSVGYGYDETTPTATSGMPQHSAVSGSRGNQTSVNVSTGSGTLTTTTAYYDTGVPVSSSSPNGTTQFSYDSTQTFTTQTTLPTPSSGVQLATSAAFDQPSGAQISATGMNPGRTTQITQYDRLLRPTVVALPNGGQINYNYVGTNESGTTQTMGNGQNAITWTLYDAYGRKSQIAVYNGQSSNPWYQVDVMTRQVYFYFRPTYMREGVLITRHYAPVPARPIPMMHSEG